MNSSEIIFARWDDSYSYPGKIAHKDLNSDISTFRASLKLLLDKN